MAEILCVYRQVAMLQADSGHRQDQDSGASGSLAIVSYDEKPGIQAIATTAPDRPPLPCKSPTVMRDHEYKRHGTLTLMAGIDLFTGHVHALLKERHRSRELKRSPERFLAVAPDAAEKWQQSDSRYHNAPADHVLHPFSRRLRRKPCCRLDSRLRRMEKR
jgi:hypothetical protein